MAKKEPGVGTLVGKGRITGPDSVKLGKMLRVRGLGWEALCDSQVPRRCHCETHTLPFFFADTDDDDDVDDDDDDDDDDDFDDDDDDDDYNGW